MNNEVEMKALPWRPMSSAPRDGQSFVLLRRITVVQVGKEPRFEHYLDVVRRDRSSAESPGYWMGLGRSIPDLELGANCWWAPLGLHAMETTFGANWGR